MIETMQTERNGKRTDKVRIGSIIILVLLLTLVARIRGGILPSYQYELAGIEADVRRLRQLQQTNTVRFEFITKEEADRRWDRSFAEHSEPEPDAQLLLFYRALDLIERDFDLNSATLEYTKSQTSGYYDSDAKMMVIILPEHSPLMHTLNLAQELTYVHEYAHALQDQRFDLGALAKRTSESNNLDFQLSQSALVEGDASFVTLDYLLEQWRESSAAVEHELEATKPRETAELDSPAILYAISEFKYEIGKDFVTELWIQRGWRGVDRAYSDNPPQTSEQILHPERYLAGEGALPVAMPEHSALIEEGWRIGYDNAVGEFILRQHLESRRLAGSHRLADGWGGDRLRIFTSDKGEDMIWVWYQVWDSERDAREFVEGYRLFLDQRYAAESTDGQCWSSETTHCFARTSATETRITMAPDRETARALLGLLD